MTTQQITSQQNWQHHISQWKQSTLNQAQYCREHNIKESAFSYHKSKLAHSSKISSSALVKSTGFIKLPVPQVIPHPELLTLHLHGGLLLSGIASSNIDAVKQLVGALS